MGDLLKVEVAGGDHLGMVAGGDLLLVVDEFAVGEAEARANVDAEVFGRRAKADALVDGVLVDAAEEAAPAGMDGTNEMCFRVEDKGGLAVSVGDGKGDIG